MKLDSSDQVAYRPILRAALSVADPKQAVQRVFSLKGNQWSVQDRIYPVDKIRNIVVIAAGKAAVPMAEAVIDITGDRLTGGVVVTPHGSGRSLGRFSVLEAGHPVPDRFGLKAGKLVMEAARKAELGDLVIVLLSGGASSLLPAPVDSITLQDKKRVTEVLLRSGAGIDEINVVRKHLSQIKGGQLAQMIYPATSLTLILSDVLDRDLPSIASGPTVPDPSHFSDAVSILKEYKILKKVPASVRKYLQAGGRGKFQETPKPGNPVFKAATHCIVGDNRLSVEAAGRQARSLGFKVLVLTTSLKGEAREMARAFGAFAREIHQSGYPIPRPACILAGGELRVKVTGRGRGGRAQEFALAAALEISGLPDTTVIGFGTDGRDGPTDAAGGLSNGETVERAQQLGLNLKKALSDNNAYEVLRHMGDLILTGPTGTNVNDLYLLLMP